MPSWALKKTASIKSEIGSGFCFVYKESGSGFCFVYKESGSGFCFVYKESGSGFCFVYKESGSGFCFVYKEPGSLLHVSINELVEYNPWWKDKKAIESDPDIQSWNESALKWNPRLRQTFNMEDYVYSLRGPRQVGKTTLVKLEIKRVLEIVPKWNVMYYSFELESSPRDVVNVINEYFNRTKHDKNKRHFMYLDEISNIKDWQKGIKKLKDQGKLKNCTVIATGSHSIDLRHATELLPGRRGIPKKDTLDKILPPIKFGEFVPAMDKQIEKEILSKRLLSTRDRFSIIKGLVNGSIDGKLLEFSVYQNELDKYFESYLLTGGVPTAINEFLKNGFIQDSVYQIYVDAIRGDLKRANKDTSYMVQLLPNIIKSITTQTSWDSLKKNSDIGSHHTVEEYIKTLSEMFVLSIFYKYNSVDDKPKFDGLKKIFFHDSFFMHALNGYITQKDPYKLSLKLLDDSEFKSKIVEQVVADHCIRMAFNMASKKAGFSYQSSVFYWQGKASREVDFVVRVNDVLIPIEVKYQNQIKKDDLYGIIDFNKTTKTNRGIIITKNELRVEDDAVLIPASLFLMLI